MEAHDVAALEQVVEARENEARDRRFGPLVNIAPKDVHPKAHGPSGHRNADVTDPDDAYRLSVQAVTGSLSPSPALELVVHHGDVPLEVKDETKRKVSRLLRVCSRRVRDDDAALGCFRVVDAVNSATMPGYDLEVGERADDACRHPAVPQDDRICAIDKVDDFLTGHGATVRTDSHLAACGLKPLDGLLGEDSK